MIFAKIADGRVVNLVETESQEALPGLINIKSHTRIGDLLLPDGSAPEEIVAWNKADMEQRRFTESEPPTDEYTTLEPPAYCTGWDADAGAWVADIESQLKDAKVGKKAEIDTKTDVLVEKHGLSYGGERFAMTSGAKLNWTGLLAAKDILTFPYYILTIDDKPFALANMNALLGFVAAVMGYETAADSPLASGRVLRQRIEAAATLAELEAIVDDRE